MTDSSTTADQTVLVLYPPRLPRATTPVTGAVYGVPKHIYDLEPMGCTVEVGAYGEQARGDTVSINLNGELALDSRQTQDINDTVTLYIPHGKLLPGIVNRLTYTVTRGSENLGTSEPPLEILYNSIRPGIEDTTPGDNAHSELVLLLPDEIKNGVGPGFTRATVCVAYPYCRAYDRIRLNCNGHDVYHSVSVTEAPPPAAHGSATPTTVCFEVTSADLRDDPEFRFSFTVNDQLNNSPDPDAPWSAVHIVDVDQAGSRLPQPIPREIASDATDDPATIDLEKLGANPLLLIVLTGDSRFLPGDTVEATYITKVTGQPDVEVSATGTVEVDELGQKKACVLMIPNDKVIPNSTVKMSYRLFRNTVPVGSSKIASAIVIGMALEPPAPSVKEAVGGQINLINVPNGATAQIPIEADLAAGDSGVVRWVGLPGIGSIAVPFDVLLGDVGSIKEVPVPRSVVEANVDQSITLDYTLRRQDSSSPIPSKRAVYDVRRQAGSGLLLVMGARGTSNSLHWSTVGVPRWLSALNKSTLQPLEAFWQYEGDSSDPIRGALFRDNKPWRLLRAWTSDDEVRINPANLFGAGSYDISKPSQLWGAFVARRNQGNLVGWGVAGHGGEIPSTIATFTDIVSVAHAAYAFAARRQNGRVVAWGKTDRGGTVPAEIANLTDIVEVLGTGHAFVARRETGHVVAWGDVANGGTIPSDIAQLDDVVEVAATAHAFAARRANGTVVAWGSPQHAATVPGDIASLNDIEELGNAYWAFAARRANRSVVAWGTEPGAGGVLPAPIATLTDIIEIVGAGLALAARRANGSVVAWGDTNKGGTVPEPILALTDIVQVVSTAGSFAALRASGHVVAWGHPDYGAPVPPTIGVFDDIVQLAATSASFAALRRNGTVVAWGYEAWGGLVNVSGLTDVRALYANSQAFAALTSDARVITWGLAGAGGNSDAVQGHLRGQVSYYATPASRGALLDLQTYRHRAEAVEGATITR